MSNTIERNRKALCLRDLPSLLDLRVWATLRDHRAVNSTVVRMVRGVPFTTLACTAPLFPLMHALAEIVCEAICMRAMIEAIWLAREGTEGRCLLRGG
jgi:hypothetical protein